MRRIFLFLVFIPSFCLADGGNSELNQIWNAINNGFANSYQSTERIGDNADVIRQIVESNPYRHNEVISSFNNLQSLLQSWSALTAKESTLSAAKSTLDSIKTVLQNRLDGYFPDFAEYLSDISSASSSVGKCVTSPLPLGKFHPLFTSYPIALSHTDYLVGFKIVNIRGAKYNFRWYFIRYIVFYIITLN